MLKPSTMEFAFKSYDVRVVQNATDTIIRAEERESRKLFEGTFFDRDFPDYAALGGLEFAIKMLLNGLQGVKDVILSVNCLEKTELQLVVQYCPSMFPKPIFLTFLLSSVRRASAAEDVETMGRRIKELETRLLEMNALNERLEEMEERLTEVEEMGEEVVLIPGMSVIPRTIESFIIIQYPQSVLDCDIWINNTKLPAGHTVDSHFPQFKKNTAQQLYADVPPPPSSVRNLARLTSCKNVTIYGRQKSRVGDVEYIGQLGSIRELNLVNIENLMDLSWITGCEQLTHVVLYGCINLHDISPLRELKHLIVLDIRGTNVKNTDFLTNSRLTITK